MSKKRENNVITVLVILTSENSITANLKIEYNSI